jgi:hypothetical protein
MKKQNRWRRLLRQTANFFEKNLGKWTQGSVARDEFGNDVTTLSPQACEFCLAGGLAKVANYDTGTAGHLISENCTNKTLRTAASKLSSKSSWWMFNDRAKSKKEVIAKLREIADSD